MRLGTRLFAALVLAGALATAARAQVPGSLTYPQASGYTGPYSVYGPGLTYRQDPSKYTGPYSASGFGLTSRQDSGSTRPDSGRNSSASGPAQTRTNADPSSRAAGSKTQTGNGRGRGGDADRPDAGRAAATDGEPGAYRRRYVRISIGGNAIQALIVP